MFKQKGKVSFIGDTKQVSDKFSKREFVLDIAGYKEGLFESVCFEAQMGNTKMVDALVLGEEAIVEFALRGRKWEKDGRVSYYNSLVVTSIDVITKAGKQVAVTPELIASAPKAADKRIEDFKSGGVDDDDDSLPF